MNRYLDSSNFPVGSAGEKKALAESLAAILQSDGGDGVLPLLGRYRKILGDNLRRGEWDDLFARLQVLFKCGQKALLDGPMIGVTLAIRDSDYFRQTARQHGADRSAVANIEWMATCWNATFGPTGLWMGKTFEPVSREVYVATCGEGSAAAYDPATTRLGRNFFRDPAAPTFIQGLGMPTLTAAWGLKPRPLVPGAPGFDADILPENLAREIAIPYTMTGGYFIARPGRSVTPEMGGKEVFQLNYRWPRLGPAYPMTRLVDELVQIDDGVYLGQLVMATKHYSLGTIRLPLVPGAALELGEAYNPDHPEGLARLLGLFGHDAQPDYGYQNNGFFLMIDTSRAREAYGDSAFPQLRPRPGESGYAELGFDRSPIRVATQPGAQHFPDDSWLRDERLRSKFTTLCLEPSPRQDDGDVRDLLREGETVLQMLQRLQGEVSAATCTEDSLGHFDKLHRLFRAGIAPGVVGGVFQGQGRGYNSRFDGTEPRQWYGGDDPCRGFDYYHGATLNLHLGIGDTLRQEARKLSDLELLPSALAFLLGEEQAGPNLLNQIWASIGRFIFPWGGKSFERVSPRKLSMLLDESPDLAARYPERVAELQNHPASWPHYDLVTKSAAGHWPREGLYAPHLRGGCWDNGMSDVDRQWWETEANSHWVFGNNLQDSRILPADELFRTLDMNYRPPLPSVQRLADSGPSPFVRQGYVFLGVGDRESILPLNSGSGGKKKRVFQFHYRYPMIGGPFPIGLCLDELVEIAEGLFLGQLIYATAPLEPFRSSVAPAAYKYQLFGYFLLLDNDWEQHRRAIGFDVDRAG
jgi:hypothetical protein